MSPTDRPPLVVIEDDLAGDEARLIADALPSGRWLLVADPDTWEASGKRIAEAVPSAMPLALPSKPKPDISHIDRIVTQAEGAAGLIAVGSGTVNDIVKLAAHRQGIPYVVFPTAPSMNGYGSANASIIEQGWRKSVPATAPRAIYCDVSVLAEAPRRLIAAGLGDTLCRGCVQADWLLSHHLTGTLYSAETFAPMIAAEHSLLAALPSLIARRSEGVRALMQSLLVSGEAMRVAGSSMPASQGEHMIAHTLGMMGRDIGLHGEQIAVTTMTMLDRQHRMLGRDMPPLSEPDVKVMTAAFGKSLAFDLLSESAGKREKLGTLPAAELAERWQSARSAIEAVLSNKQRIAAAFAALGAPVTPDAIGWDMADYTVAVALAPHTRDRLTFLDFV